MSNDRPGTGLLGWLGRQIGYVKRAIQTDPASEIQKIYRNESVQEQPLPDDPNVTLRRTMIDEVIVKKPPNSTNAMNAQKDSHGIH